MLKPYTAWLVLVLGVISVVVSSFTGYKTATPPTRDIAPVVTLILEFITWVWLFSAGLYLLSVALGRRAKSLADFSTFVFIVGMFIAIVTSDGSKVTFYSYEEVCIFTYIIVFAVLPPLDKHISPDTVVARKEKDENIWIDYPEDSYPESEVSGITPDGEIVFSGKSK